MNWYKKAELSFDFESEKNRIWNEILKKEQEFHNLSFDLENNYISEKMKSLKTGIDDIKVYAELWNAGGDWECPISYFRCQVKKGSRLGPKFIYIPSRKEGNLNLSSDGSGEKYPLTEQCKKIDNKKLWHSLKNYIDKRIIEYYDNDEKRDSLNMYDYDRSLNLFKDIARKNDCY